MLLFLFPAKGNWVWWVGWLPVWGSLSLLVGCMGALQERRLARSIDPPQSVHGMDPSPDSLQLARVHLARANQSTKRRLGRSITDTPILEYYRGAILAWRYLDSAQSSPGSVEIAQQIYGDCLSGMMQTATKTGRLIAGQGLQLENGTNLTIRTLGVGWSAEQLDRFSFPSPNGQQELISYRSVQGMGVAMVGIHENKTDPNYRPQSYVPLTALLRPGPTGHFQLDLVDPHSFDHVDMGGRQLRLCRDTSAPWALAFEEIPRSGIQSYLIPTEPGLPPSLTMLAPYKPGKIPIVLIHGLFSEPMTWTDMINELENEPEIYARYQIWAFRYPTDGRFLESAAAMRKMLAQLRQRVDPLGTDLALDRMVVVGHSLGGLIAKGQTIESEGLVWEAIAKGPFQGLRGNPSEIATTAQEVYFQPSPTIRRVVYIGTPHNGTSFARGFLARSGERIITQETPATLAHREFLERNSDVFCPRLRDCAATMLDQLEPNQPTLLAMNRARRAPWITTNSIMGEGGWFGLGGPTDGIVNLASAKNPGDQSEKIIRGIHTHLHRNPETFVEVFRILKLHCQNP